MSTELTLYHIKGILWWIVTGLVLLAAFVGTYLMLFTLAFLDDPRPLRSLTFNELLEAPVVIVGVPYLLVMLSAFAIMWRWVSVAARCARLESLARGRLNGVRGKCAAFYDEHGRAPGAEDRETFAKDLTPTKEGLALVCLAGNDGVTKIKGRAPVFATAKPFKSAYGWRCVLLLDDGSIQTIKRYRLVRRFYRSVENALGDDGEKSAKKS